MSIDVFLTADAACDLEEIYQYIIRHDTPGKTDHADGLPILVDLRRR